MQQTSPKTRPSKTLFQRFLIPTVLLAIASANARNLVKDALSKREGRLHDKVAAMASAKAAHLEDDADHIAFPVFDQIVNNDLSKKFTPEQAKQINDVLDRFAKSQNLVPYESIPKDIESDRNFAERFGLEFSEQTTLLRIRAHGLGLAFIKREYSDRITDLLSKETEAYSNVPFSIMLTFKNPQNTGDLVHALYIDGKPDLKPLRQLNDELKAIAPDAPKIRTLEY